MLNTTAERLAKVSSLKNNELTRYLDQHLLLSPLETLVNYLATDMQEIYRLGELFDFDEYQPRKDLITRWTGLPYRPQGELGPLVDSLADFLKEARLSSGFFYRLKAENPGTLMGKYSKSLENFLPTLWRLEKLSEHMGPAHLILQESFLFQTKQSISLPKLSYAERVAYFEPLYRLRDSYFLEPRGVTLEVYVETSLALFEDDFYRKHTPMNELARAELASKLEAQHSELLLFSLLPTEGVGP